MWHNLTSTVEGRSVLSGAVAVGLHVLLVGVFALIVVSVHVEPPEFMELNVGRLSQQQLTRLIRDSEQAVTQSSPEERVAAPDRRLPEVDMPAISPTEQERRLLPSRVSLDEERVQSPPPRPAGTMVPVAPAVGAGEKVMYEGTRLDIGQRPGEGIESEHVGSDIQPVFLIEGQLRGRRFHQAAITEVPEMPARTQIKLDVIVAPRGSVISAIVVRRENAELEEFATSFIRRCRFDPLPAAMPQENQSGRVTITFTPRQMQGQ